jgi:phosphohistidine phosphatase SixA
LIRRVLLSLLLCWPALALAADGPWQALEEPGVIVLFRHANAPGTGDPPGFKLGDCATQRNLDAKGRAEARAIGEAFRRKGVKVGMVLSSQWCRSRETAALAFPGRVTDAPAFNSFFGNRAAEPEQTLAALDILLNWRGPGVLVVVTHQVNISALTGIAPQPGEGIVVQAANQALRLLGRLPPPALQQ